MRSFLLVLILFLSAAYSTLIAQSSLGCDGDRYRNEVFTDYQSSLSVQFGQAITLGGSSYTLIMDIYEPLGDSLNQRPVVVLAHGGSFIFGDRSELRKLCQDLAKRGFVAATIEYRLLDAFVTDSIAISEEVVMAIADMRAAVRYFREDAATNNTYKADPDMIFVGGTSAGAITAAHVAMLDTTDEIPAYVQTHIDANGGFEGNSSTNTQYSSQVQGLLNYSGALLRDHWIDAEDPPFYSAHDEFDLTVPCDYGTTNAVFFPVYLYGSCEMQTVADTLGIDNQLYLVEGSIGHVSFMGPLTYGTILDESANFLAGIICTDTMSTDTMTTSLAETSEVNPLRLFPNPNQGRFTLEVSPGINSYDVAIYALTGQRVYWRTEIKQASFLMSESRLDAGAYVVMITDRATGKQYREKVLVAN